MQTLRKNRTDFGKVHVNFGEPVFLDDLLKQHGAENIVIEKNDDPVPAAVSEAINSSAVAILENINRAVVINPVSLLSLILLATRNIHLMKKYVLNSLMLTDVWPLHCLMMNVLRLRLYLVKK